MRLLKIVDAERTETRVIGRGRIWNVTFEGEDYRTVMQIVGKSKAQVMAKAEEMLTREQPEDEQ